MRGRWPTTVVAAVALLIPSRPSHALPITSSWQVFLAHPTRVNYTRLADGLRACDGRACDSLAIPDSLVLSLAAEVRRGNWCGIDLAVLSLKTLGGGDREDACLSLGEALERWPEFVLESTRASCQPYALHCILWMLPADVPDGRPGLRRIIERRISALSGVKTPYLLDIRDRAVSDLRGRLERSEY